MFAPMPVLEVCKLAWVTVFFIVVFGNRVLAHELFDQLYKSWGSLEKFQRTRGVLRLMAQAIHELWMNGEAHRPAPLQTTATGTLKGSGDTRPAGDTPITPQAERKPTRFTGTVMISPDRPARDMHQIVEAIVEQLTTLPGSEVTLSLEIQAEIPLG